ncbi:hypothetical protein J6590_001183 [Homalodisca vitripennis]|nr:hypothetical protein J6590_001183 [Homalodisca vitripennis]
MLFAHIESLAYCPTDYRLICAAPGHLRNSVISGTPGMDRSHADEMRVIFAVVRSSVFRDDQAQRSRIGVRICLFGKNLTKDGLVAPGGIVLIDVPIGNSMTEGGNSALVKDMKSRLCSHFQAVAASRVVSLRGNILHHFGIKVTENINPVGDISDLIVKGIDHLTKAKLLVLTQANRYSRSFSILLLCTQWNVSPAHPSSRLHNTGRDSAEVHVLATALKANIVPVRIPAAVIGYTTKTQGFNTSDGRELFAVRIAILCSRGLVSPRTDFTALSISASVVYPPGPSLPARWIGDITAYYRYQCLEVYDTYFPGSALDLTPRDLRKTTKFLTWTARCF